MYPVKVGTNECNATCDATRNVMLTHPVDRSK